MTTTHTPATTSTRALLTCGILASPLFSLVVLVQSATRPGFDPKVHPLSLLSNGDLGWIQIANFCLAGILVFASAFGLRRVLAPGRGTRWIPILIGAQGVSLVWGGVFVADPAFGFPIGTPAGGPAELTWHGTLHAIAPGAAGVALIVACVIFARRFTADGRRGWAVYSIATAAVYAVSIIITFPLDDYRYMLAGGIAIWVWAALATARMLPRR